MANWYCDYTNGNDTTGSGTSGSPYKTIQKLFDVATGGDVLNIANTSAQALAANFSLSAFTEDNTKATIIQAWDNGGSLTIQRPDEATARDAGVIDGANTYTFSTAGASRFLFKDIRFKTFDGKLVFNELNICYGCEFTDISNAGDTGISFYDRGISLNCYFHDNDAITTTEGIFDSTFLNNYFSDNIPVVVYGDRAVINLNTNSSASGNIFVDNGIRCIRAYGSGLKILNNNTFVSDGAASLVGIEDITNDTSIYNNIFYNFDGSGAKAINQSGGSIAGTIGYNAFYDCNSSTYLSQILLDLRANDISTTGDPFVNSAGNDYSVAGSAAANAGLGNP